MPIKSKSQLRWLGWAERNGKVKRGTLHRWAVETPNLRKLPERVGTRRRSTKPRLRTRSVRVRTMHRSRRRRR